MSNRQPVELHKRWRDWLGSFQLQWDLCHHIVNALPFVEIYLGHARIDDIAIVEA
jgi:hypothetical protein